MNKNLEHDVIVSECDMTTVELVDENKKTDVTNASMTSETDPPMVVETIEIPSAAREVLGALVPHLGDANQSSLPGMPFKGYPQEQSYVPSLARLELIQYLKKLYEPNDYVGYCVSTMVNEAGKKVPHVSNYSRTRNELLHELIVSESIDDALGTIDPEAGAWMYCNPLDGKGVTAEHVAAYRYALVESDCLSLEEQMKILKDVKLPIKTLVYSGHKSLHAIASIEAPNKQVYDQRVAMVYEYLEKHGFSVDSQNKNPNRMTRMPGVLRGDAMQHMVDVDWKVPASWAEWEEMTHFEREGIPPYHRVADVRHLRIPKRPVLIDGVLRKGHKMILTGPSKAGKSFLLLELAEALSRGLTWLDFQCTKSKVMYIDFEVDEASGINRIQDIEQAMVLDEEEQNLHMWSLKGFAKPLGEMLDFLIRSLQGKGFEVLIIDPIYKIMGGDENNASQMAEFCNQLDYLGRALDCSIISCHHHSKGDQSQKKLIDRSSGSGVFGRDPDAIIDLLEINLEDVDQEVKDEKGYLESTTAWRVDGVFREFPGFAPKYMTFEYPVHKLDNTGFLRDVFHGKHHKEPYKSYKSHDHSSAPSNSDDQAVVDKRKVTKSSTRTERIELMVETLEDMGAYTKEEAMELSIMAKILGVEVRTVRRYTKAAKDVVVNDNKMYLLSD